MVNRERLFSKWNDVSIQQDKGDTYICYECKLYDNKHDITIANIETAVNHIELHEKEGHKIWGHQIKKLRLTKKIKEECVTSVKIYYAVSNNGDGSASVHFFKTEEDAKAFDAYEQEHYDGWGESEYFTEILHFDKDGILINAAEPDYEDEEE